jgi:flagellar assembly protein FliH
MSSSPDLLPVEGVVRAADAAELPAARFDTNLRGAVRVPEELVADARAAAHAAGYAAGWTEGQHRAGAIAREGAALAREERRQAAEARAAAMERALTAMANAATGLEHRALPVAAEIEEVIVHAAVTLAETLIGRELAIGSTLGEDAMRRALALAPDRRPVTVRLSPLDHATLVGDGSNRLEVDGRTVTVLADPLIELGDAIADSDATTVDARIGPALERVREVLGL